MPEEQIVFNDLRKKGYRITPQRARILAFFKDLPEGNHLSTEDLQILLQKNNIKISLATLYRNLKFLVAQGLLRELDFAEAHKHYEYVSDENHHHHLICNICGKTTEFHDQSIINVVAKASKAQIGFKITDFQLKIFGICANCR